MNELALRQMQITAAKEEIRRCNELNQLYGLTLTESDITELVELRGQALRSTGRVEFGGGILPKLIRAFCKSPYVDPYNYATTLGARGFYVSLPKLSKFWQYLPIPQAGFAMIVFEIECLVNNLKKFFVKEEA